MNSRPTTQSHFLPANRFFHTHIHVTGLDGGTKHLGKEGARLREHSRAVSSGFETLRSPAAVALRPTALDACFLFTLWSIPSLSGAAWLVHRRCQCPEMLVRKQSLISGWSH